MRGASLLARSEATQLMQGRVLVCLCVQHAHCAGPPSTRSPHDPHHNMRAPLAPSYTTTHPARAAALLLLQQPLLPPALPHCCWRWLRQAPG
jgi:hypothetical protein